MNTTDNQQNEAQPGGEKQTFAVRRLAALAALRKIAHIVEDERKADAAEKKWSPRVIALLILLISGFLVLTLYNNKPIDYTHTGVTSREVALTLQFTDGKSMVVNIPEGTRCIKLTRAFTPWVVDDPAFMNGKSLFLVKYAKDYGIIVPEADVRDIKQVAAGK